jgi:hypothetical protein
VPVQRKEAGHGCRQLIIGHGRIGFGMPRADQASLVKEPDRGAGIPDIGRQESHQSGIVTAVCVDSTDARLPETPQEKPMEPTPEHRAKLYINTGLVTDRSDIYNILRPLLKQTVTYSYFRGNQVASGGTGWVERLVVDHPEIASYFTPLSICLNLDSFDYLQFDTTSDQLLTYTLVIGSEKVVIEFAQAATEIGIEDEAPIRAAMAADDLVLDPDFIQMELLKSPDAPDEDEDA